MLGQPFADLGMLVGGIVVDDCVDILASGNLGVDGVEEADELLMATTLHVAADNGAVENVEGGEQSGRPMAFVIMSHGTGAAGLHRQARLGAIEGLTAVCGRDVHDNVCSHTESLNCFWRFGNRPNESDH